MDDTAPKPWERLPDESPMWYSRFMRYLRQGAGERSVPAAWVEERKEKGKSISKRPQTSWYHAHERFRWDERAEAWDLEMIRIETGALMAAKHEIKKQALELLQKSYDELLAKLKEVNLIGVRSVGGLIKLSGMLLDQYQAFFDEKPTQRIDSGSTAPAIVINTSELELPPETTDGLPASDDKAN